MEEQEFTLTEEQRNQFEETFQKLKDEDDVLTADKITEALEDIGLSSDLASDKDITESMNREQFLEFMAQLIAESNRHASQDLPPPADVDIRTAFRFFDYDNIGFIKSEVLRQVLTEEGDKLTEEEIEGLLHDAGSDDGYLDYESFVKKMDGTPKNDKN